MEHTVVCMYDRIRNAFKLQPLFSVRFFWQTPPRGGKTGGKSGVSPNTIYLLHTACEMSRIPVFIFLTYRKLMMNLLIRRKAQTCTHLQNYSEEERIDRKRTKKYLNPSCYIFHSHSTRWFTARRFKALRLSRHQHQISNLKSKFGDQNSFGAWRVVPVL